VKVSKEGSDIMESVYMSSGYEIDIRMVGLMSRYSFGVPGHGGVNSLVSRDLFSAGSCCFSGLSGPRLSVGLLEKASALSGVGADHYQVTRNQKVKTT
jgi:hypothetical protein